MIILEDSGLQTTPSNIQPHHLPAIYKMIDFKKSDVILDYGCGRYFNKDVKPYIDEHELFVLPYDKYGRTKEQNEDTLKWIEENGRPNIILLSNVLNVVEPEEERIAILRNCYNLLADGGTLYVKIFTGTNNNIPSYYEKSNSLQLNRSVDKYLPECELLFSVVSVNKNLIILNKKLP